MQQVFCNTLPLAGSTTTSYASPMQGRTWNTTQANGTHPWIVAGAFDQLTVTVPTAPGAGKSITYTLQVNGVDTALTVTISGTATTASDSSHVVAVTASDTISLKRSTSGTPTLAATKTSLRFTGETYAESGYGYSAITVLGTTSNRWNGVFAGNDTWGTVNGQKFHNVVAAAGVLNGYKVLLDGAPGSGTSYAFVLYKNGVKQDGTGGTPDTSITISNTATSGSASFSLTLAAGDLIYIENVPTGTPTARRASVGARFTATTNGESQVCGYYGGAAMNQAATAYEIPSGQDDSISWDTTESNRDTIGGQTTFTLRGMQVWLNGTAGASKSYTLKARKNGADPASGPSVTISGSSATTGSDATGSVSIASGDTWSISETPSGTPTARLAVWAWVQYIAPVVRSTSQTGNWSSYATWGGLPAPTDGDQAIVAHAVTVDVDTTVGAALCTSYQTRPTASATGSGGSLPAGSYRLRIAAVGSTGSTTASAPTLTITITAGQVIRVTLPTLPAGAASWSVYLTNTGGATGTEHRYATGKSAGTFDCSSASWEDGTTTYAAAATLPNGDAIRATALLTVAAGKTLTVKGDITHTAGITVNAGGKIQFRTTGAPATSYYRLLFGSVDTQGTGVLTMRGSSGSRAVIATEAGSTAGSIEASAQTSTNGNVRLDVEWGRFSTLGASGRPAAAVACSAAYNQLQTDVVWDADCYEVVYSSVPATGGWIETRVTYRQAQGGTYGSRTCCVSYGVGTSTVSTGTRTCTQVVWEALPPALSAGGATYDGCYFNDCWANLPVPGTGGASASNYTIQNCFVRKLVSGATGAVDDVSLIGNTTDNYLYLDNITGPTTTDLNPHGCGCPANGTGTTRTHLRWTCEYNGDDDSGDMFKNPGAVAGTVEILYPLIVPNHSGKASGTVYTFPNNPSSSYRLRMEHGTWIGGPYSLSTSEGGAQPAGTISSLKSNLAYNPGRTTINRYLLGKSDGDGSTDTTDIVAPANVTNNAGWNLLDVTGSYSGGYSWYNTKFSSAPGSGDVDLGDTGADPTSAGPRFVDWTRNFEAWCVSALGATGTRSQIITTGLNALKAIADTTSANHVVGLVATDPATWVRAGFAPQASSLNGAAHDGTTIGAVAYVSTGTAYDETGRLGALLLALTGETDAAQRSDTAGIPLLALTGETDLAARLDAASVLLLALSGGADTAQRLDAAAVPLLTLTGLSDALAGAESGSVAILSADGLTEAWAGDETGRPVLLLVLLDTTDDLTQAQAYDETGRAVVVIVGAGAAQRWARAHGFRLVSVPSGETLTGTASSEVLTGTDAAGALVGTEA